MKLKLIYYGSLKEYETEEVSANGGLQMMTFPHEDSEDKIAIFEVEYDEQKWDDATAITQQIAESDLDEEEEKEIKKFVKERTETK